MTRSKTKIWIASDHAGLEVKKRLQEGLPEYEWHDLGPMDSQNSVDYPDYAEKVGKKIQEDPESLGVLICGSGVGMSIAANKMPSIRAALVSNPIAARLAREHNNANVLCLGARFVAPEYAMELVQAWAEGSFSKEPRHQNRLQKLHKLEK